MFLLSIRILIYVHDYTVFINDFVVFVA